MSTWRRWSLVGFLALAASCGDSGSSAGKDTTPPTFAGATEATPLAGGVLRVRWEAGRDNVSPPSRLLYRVFAAPRGEPIDYERHYAVSPAGATSLGVHGLPQGIPLDLVVRAVDEAGNVDENTNAIEVTVPSQQVPQFAGVEAVVPRSASSLEVRWSPATDDIEVEKYLVYLSKDEPPFSAKPIEVPAEDTSFVFEELQEATTYFAAVRAVAGDGRQDGNRLYLPGTTLDVTPPKFTGIEAVWVGGTAVLLQWKPAKDNVTAPENIRYHVYSGTPGNFDFDEPTVTVKGETFVTLKGLEPNKQIHFVVRAEDEAGNVDKNTASDSVVTGAAPDDTPPVFAGATGATTLGARSVRLTWAAGNDDLTPASALLYDVWYSTTSGAIDFLGEPQATSAPGATSVDVGGLEPATTYYFVVRARDLEGFRDENEVEVSATTKADDTPPVFAGVSAVKGINATTLEVSWLPAADDTFPPASISYDVFLAEDSGEQNFAVPTKTVTGETSTQITGLVRDTKYFVVVRARDPEGNVAESTKELSASTLPDTTPPVLAGAPEVSALTETSLQVSWPAATDDSYPSEDLRYTVWYREAPSGTYVALAETALTTVSITNLDVDTTYNVYVVARDPSNNEAQSPTGTAKTSSDATPPTFAGTPTFSASTTINLNTGLRNSVTVSWTAATDNVTPQNEIYYEICVGTGASCGTFVASATTNPGVTTRTFTNLPLDVRYYYTIRAVDAAGNRTALAAATIPAPSKPALPTLAYDGNANLSATFTPSTSAFSNLRYRIDYWDNCNSSGAWVAASTLLPRSTGTTVTGIKGFIGANYVRVVAIDGFGTMTEGNYATIQRSTSLQSSATLNPLFTASCNLGGACHYTPASAPYNMVAWTTTTAKQTPSPGGYADAAVNENSTNAASSRMWVRIDNGSMPPGGPFPAELECNLVRWIALNAP